MRVSARRSLGGHGPDGIGLRGQPFPGLDQADRFAHAREQLLFAVVVLPAAAVVELDQVSATLFGERAPFLRELGRHAARYLLGHRPAPPREKRKFSSRRAYNGNKYANTNRAPRFIVERAPTPSNTRIPNCAPRLCE